jgi:DNA-binding phage protein
MKKLSEDWNIELAKKLKNKRFTREFLLAAMDEGVPLQDILKKIVNAYGVAEFAKIVSMAPPNVLRAVDLRHNPTRSTLDALIKPFGLMLGLQPIKKKKPA